MHRKLTVLFQYSPCICVTYVLCKSQIIDESISYVCGRLYTTVTGVPITNSVRKLDTRVERPEL